MEQGKKNDNTADKFERKAFKHKVRKSTIKGEIFKSILSTSYGVILLVMLIFSSFMYHQGVKHFSIMMEEEAKTISSRTTNYFNNIENTFNVLSAHPDILSGNESKLLKSEILPVLSIIEQFSSNVNQILIGYEDNKILVNDEVDMNKYVVTERAWYKEAKANPAKLIIGTAYYSERKDKQVFAISKAIQEKGHIVGVLSVDCQLEALYEMFEEESSFTTKFVFMANSKTNFVFSKKYSEIDTQLLKNYPELFSKEEKHLKIKIDKVKYLVYSYKLPGTDWTLIARVNYSEIINPIIRRVTLSMIFLLILTLLASTLIAKIVSKKIAKPVIEISSALRNFAKDNNSIQKIEVNQNNEIGTMIESFNYFIENTMSLKADINNLKSIQNKLSHSLSLVNASLESTNDGVMIVDNDNVVKKWNHKLLNLWGITEEEVTTTIDELLSLKTNSKIMRIEQSEQLIGKVQNDQARSSFDILELHNGKIIERSSFSQKIANEIVGRVWRFRDVTDKRRIETELKANEQNFREFFESMKDMVFISDYNGNIIYTNKSASRELGYSFSELTTMNLVDIHGEEFEDEANALLEPIMKGERVTTQVSLSTKDGYKIPVDIQLWLGIWDGGDYIFGVCKDLSKELEALTKFNKIFESNPALMALTTYPDRVFVDVNEAFCKTYELKKEDIIGKRVDSMSVINGSQNYTEKSKMLFKKGSFKNLYMEITTPSGKIVHGLLAEELIETGKNKFSLIVMTDITEKENLDRELRKSERKYRLLFENMTSGFALHQMIYDEAGKPIDYKFLAVNPAFEALTGSEEQKLIGKTVKETLPMTEDYWIDSYGKVAKTGKSQEFVQYSQAFNKYFEVRAFSPEPDKFAVIFTDVTARRKSLQALEKEKELAQAATKAKSEFLANMSHEIRTPLNGVIGFTDLLLDTQLNQNQHQYAINANISGKALLGIINDVLDFSKIESGKMELEFVYSNVVELLEQATDIIKFLSCQKRLDLILNVPVAFPETIKIDPTRFKQIILNLLNNAVKFTNKGSIELIVGFVPLTNSRGKFTFTVKDTGIGIAEEASSKLFEAFAQADGSITRKYGGTGLGLVISNFLAKKMDSQIEFVSEEGVGSEFFFIIEADYLENSNSFENTLLDSKIFIIEQNQKIIDVIQQNILYWGMEVESTDDCQGALEKLNSNEYDVLLIDFRMLKLCDYEISKLLIARAEKTSKQQTTVISYCPGDADKINVSKEELPNQQIISKPIVMKSLYNILSGVCADKDYLVKESKKTAKSKLSAFTLDSEANILIAEDVEMNMKLIKTLIAKLAPKTKIYQAKNGKEAINLYKQHNIDLILMDVQMPEIDGLEATRIIRKFETDRKKPQQTPIIALTAGAYSQDKEKCYNAGMVGFLAKPIVVKELIEVLERYL